MTVKKMIRLTFLHNPPVIISAAVSLLVALAVMFAIPSNVCAVPEPKFHSLIVGVDEIFVQRPADGGFVLPDWGARLTLPEPWRGHVLLADMPGTGDKAAKAAYGLLFYPPDIVVQTPHYLGIVLVYDRALEDDIEDETALKLGVTSDCVFVFYNSLFNPYNGLPESARFEALMLPDDVVAEQLKIEKLN